MTLPNTSATEVFEVDTEAVPVANMASIEGGEERGSKSEQETVPAESRLTLSCTLEVRATKVMSSIRGGNDLGVKSNAISVIPSAKSLFAPDKPHWAKHGFSDIGAVTAAYLPDIQVLEDHVENEELKPISILLLLLLLLLLPRQTADDAMAVDAPVNLYMKLKAPHIKLDNFRKRKK